MTEEAKMCVEWLNHYIKTDPAHKVIAHYVFGHNGDCGDYGEDWMWLDDICKQVINLIESLSAQLDQVTMERDAAVEDIPRECHKCKHFKVLFNGCTPDYDCDRSDVCKYNDNWQWRGVEKEVEG